MRHQGPQNGAGHQGEVHGEGHLRFHGEVLGVLRLAEPELDATLGQVGVSESPAATRLPRPSHSKRRALQSLLSPTCTPPHAPTRATRKKRVKYTEPAQSGSEDEDISGVSEDGSEYDPRKDNEADLAEWSEDEDDNQADPEDEDKVTEQAEKVQKKKAKKQAEKVPRKKDKTEKRKRKKADRWKFPMESDDEVEDSIEMRDARRSNRELVREVIKVKLEVEPSPWDHPTYWSIDDVDWEVIKLHIVKPLIKQSSKWSRFAKKEPEVVKQMVLSGQLPVGKNKKHFASFPKTPGNYLTGLKVLMGFLQEQLQQDDPELLMDGRLHIYQFLRFNQHKFIELPMDITRLLEKIESPVIRQFAHCGYKQLLDSVSLFLGSPSGLALFRKVAGKGLSDKEMSVVEVMAKARKYRQREMNHIENITSNLAKGKPFGSYGGEKEMERADRARFSEEFEGFELPNAEVAIPMYMSHKSTRDCCQWK